MKVLMFGWEYPPYNSGGLGVACQGLARSLAAKNISLLFILPKRLNLPSENFPVLFADIPGVTISKIKSLLVPYLTSESYRHLRSARPESSVYGDTLFEEVDRYGFCARLIAQSENFDVIHAHDWLTFKAAIEAKKVSGKPFIAHIHATEVDRTAGAVNQEIYAREKEGLNFADKVISVSAYTKDILINHYQLPPEKVEVVHNGIDYSNYNPQVPNSMSFQKLKKQGYKIVLFVGRITIMKGPDYFLEAAKKTLEFDPKILFVIVGSGDMEGQIINRAAELGISDKVLFPGFLRGLELSEVFKSADLFVMPSVSEPFGLTPLESLIHGTPVLISKQSGVSEILSHALKVDFWDTDEMADKILSVLENKSMHKVLRQNGYKEVVLCNWGNAADKCINIYNSLAISH